ncbi:hypothetical protein ACWDG9_39930 [Streptomyces sp. NPDC001073]
MIPEGEGEGDPEDSSCGRSSARRQQRVVLRTGALVKAVDGYDPGRGHAVRIGLEPLDSFTALSVDVETPGEDGGFALAGLLGERDAGSIWS